MGARVPAAPVRGSRSLTALAQAATASRLDEGNDVSVAPRLPLLLSFHPFPIGSPTFLKNNSYITLLPETLQSHLEKCKPRDNGVGFF